MTCIGPNNSVINGASVQGINAEAAPPYTYPNDWITNYTPTTNSSDYKECLPSGAPFPRTSSGGVDPAVVENHIRNTLFKFEYTVNVPPSNTYVGIPTANATAPGLSNDSPNFAKDNINPALAFANAAKKLRDNLADEYCYYRSRYKMFLYFILTIAARTDGDLNDSAYISSKTHANTINRKLNDIILIIEKISQIRQSELEAGYYATNAGVNQANSELATAKTQLDKHLALLNNSELKRDVHSAMMEYTIEKNQSSRNLLAIYGFMNIVAVGMLYYLYRNIK